MPRIIQNYKVSINSFPGYKYFFFNEPTIAANDYLDMLEVYVAPQLQEFQPWIIFEQDGAPPHYVSHVR
jgi:hypothetical protein